MLGIGGCEQERGRGERAAAAGRGQQRREGGVIARRRGWTYRVCMRAHDSEEGMDLPSVRVRGGKVHHNAMSTTQIKHIMCLIHVVCACS